METKQAEEMMNTMDIENQYSKVDVSIPLQNLFDECLNFISMEERNLRKTRQGVVLSNKMDKTIVVATIFKEKHPIYGKFVSKTKKYHAHDESNDCNVGDTVLLMETRPLSKTKRWRVVKIVERVK